jgi:hypothetical protein
MTQGRSSSSRMLEGRFIAEDSELIFAGVNGDLSRALKHHGLKAEKKHLSISCLFAIVHISVMYATH